MFVEIFLWFQNHFLQNSFASNKYFRKIFGRKVLMFQNNFLEIGLRKNLETFLGRKLFMESNQIGNWLSRKQNFENYFGPKFYIVAKSFSSK